MIDQPKPTSGEWITTAAEDGDCAIVHGDRQLVGVGATVRQTLDIVAKHNAAIAAEKKETENVANQWIQAEQGFAVQLLELREQLAAEINRREKSDEDYAEAMRQLRESDDFAVRVKTKELREQLAAAYEKGRKDEQDSNRFVNNQD